MINHSQIKELEYNEITDGMYIDWGVVVLPETRGAKRILTKIKKVRNFFFWGCRVKRGSGGAFVERTLQFRFTTRSARATSFVLGIGASQRNL